MLPLAENLSAICPFKLGTEATHTEKGLQEGFRTQWAVELKLG